MPVPGLVPNVYVQQGNRQVLISGDLTPTATNYVIQRSSDGITYATIASPVSPSYVDTTATVSTQYYYQMAAQNISGIGPYSTPQSVIPTPTAEMSLGQIRLAAQQRADRVNSNFVTLPEWNSYINQACYELYDLLITAYENYYVAAPLSFTTTPNQAVYPLPDGLNYSQASPFYKLLGIDLAVNTASNAYVTVGKFNFIDRNKYVYPNTASTIYGVFNLQYRILDSNIHFIPTPSTGQIIRMWYVPRLPQLLKDTDTTTMSISGWIEYVIVRAAYLALTKEESDTSSLVMQLQALKQRIQESAVNRDEGRPDTISDVRRNGWGYGYGGGGPGDGFQGGW